MKKRHVFTTLSLAAVFAAALCTSVCADYKMTVSLEKTGEIPEADLDYERITIYPGGLITQDADGNCYVLDEMGKNNLGRSFADANYFTDELFRVYDAETWPNSCGLVKADGTVVLPCEAAIIKTVNGTERYVKVSVATEPTDKDNAFLYTYSGWYAYPDEKSEYYDGYDQYYDLKEARYFEDLKEADPADIRGSYSRELVSGSDSCIVLDPDGEQVAELDSWPYEIYGEGEVFSLKQDDGYIVVDRSSNPISDIVFKGSPSEVNGFLYAVKAEDSEFKTVLDFDGNVYADSADEINNVLQKPYGLTLLYNGDDSSLLLYPDGTIAELGKYDGGGDLPYYQRGDEEEPRRIFVLNEGEYRELEEEYIGTGGLQGNLMICAKFDDDAEYSLYSVADGSCLLEKGGTKILSSDDWVYALKDGVWNVYKVTVNW